MSVFLALNIGREFTHSTDLWLRFEQFVAYLFDCIYDRKQVARNQRCKSTPVNNVLTKRFLIMRRRSMLLFNIFDSLQLNTIAVGIAQTNLIPG